MNKKIIPVLLLATLVILIAAPESFAKSEYFAALNTVYPGAGSCDTCHVNGPSDGNRTTYGALFENQTNHATDPVAALKAIGAPPTPALVETGTSAVTTTMPATMTMTPTPEVTTAAATATATAKSPGFGIVVSMIGLFAWALFLRRKN
jgi:PGF-CTERM protein